MINNNIFYRYRPLNPLTLKELLYGELYLSSLDELNDPYDTNINFTFPPHKEVYSRFLNHYFKIHFLDTNILYMYTKVSFSKAVEFLTKQTNTYPELVYIFDSTEFKNILFYIFRHISSISTYELVDAYCDYLKYELHKALGKFTYICSFSKVATEPIVWSHYGDQHKGFCIEFKTINGYLLKNPNTQYIFGTNHYQYKLKKILYKNKINPINAFYSFSKYINGSESASYNHKDYWKIYEESILTKSKKWAYEKEYRICISTLDQYKVTSDGSIKIPSAFRIFNYDQSQISGIILGSRVTENQTHELISTVRKIKDNLRLTNTPLQREIVISKTIVNTRKFELDLSIIDKI